MVQTNYFELAYVFLMCFWKPKRMVTKGGLDSVMIMCPQCMIIMLHACGFYCKCPRFFQFF